MIYKLLLNFNNFIFYFIALFVVCLLIYVIYKTFILETELYIIQDKLNKMEIEYCGGGSCPVSDDCNKRVIKNTPMNKDEVLPNYDISLNEIIMNNIFADNQKEQNPIMSEVVDIIDIDKIVAKNNEPNDISTIEPVKEPIFDLKKEVLADDKESIVSVSNKKKLLKFNLDKLKDKCTEYNLSTEGTKAQLIERIVEFESNQ